MDSHNLCGRLEVAKEFTFPQAVELRRGGLWLCWRLHLVNIQGRKAAVLLVQHSFSSSTMFKLLGARLQLIGRTPSQNGIWTCNAVVQDISSPSDRCGQLPGR